jgi:hypothetical protein
VRFADAEIKSKLKVVSSILWRTRNLGFHAKMSFNGNKMRLAPVQGADATFVCRASGSSFPGQAQLAKASVLGSRIFDSSDSKRIEENTRTHKSNESIGEAKAPARVSLFHNLLIVLRARRVAEDTGNPFLPQHFSIIHPAAVAAFD